MRSSIHLPVLIIVILAISSCSSSRNVSSSGSGGQTSTQSSESAHDRDGMSFETAVIAKSIKSEYEWIEANYPGAQVEMQALVRKNGKPYDVLTFVTTKGETKKAHFDISKFFGKGF
jgi:hypothetical protein